MTIARLKKAILEETFGHPMTYGELKSSMLMRFK